MRERARRPIWIASGILTAVSVLVMYKTHREIPFMMDDLWYSTLLFEDTPIASFADIVKSQVWHYNNWGGRSMTHGILQLTLLAGEYAADILNVVFTLLLGGMLCLVSGHRSLPAFFAGISMVLGLNANWKMSMFWQAGAANYLYITVFVLLYVYCYLRELSEEGSCIPWGRGSGASSRTAPSRTAPSHTAPSQGVSAGQVSTKTAQVPAAQKTPPGNRPLPGIALWILPVGVLAGWSNENIGPAVWILSLSVILLLFRETHRIRPWMIWGNLACLAGSILCIAAPGNRVRSAQIAEEQYGILWRMFLRGYAESRGALEYLFPTVLILTALLVIGKCVPGVAIGRRNLLLLFCALLSWGAFVLSPHYPDRASFGTMALCICVVLSLTGKIVRQRRDLAWPLWFGVLLIWLRGMYFCGEYLAIAWGWIR